MSNEENKNINKNINNNKKIIIILFFIISLIIFLNIFYKQKYRLEPLKNIKINTIYYSLTDDKANIILFTDNPSYNIQKYDFKSKSLYNLYNTKLINSSSSLIHLLNNNNIILCGRQNTKEEKYCELLQVNNIIKSKIIEIPISGDSIALNLDNGNALIFDSFNYKLYEYFSDKEQIYSSNMLPKYLFIRGIKDWKIFPNNIIFIINKDGEYYWFDIKKQKLLYKNTINKRYFYTVTNSDTVFIVGGSKSGISEYYDNDNEVIECKLSTKECLVVGKLKQSRANCKASLINSKYIVLLGGEKKHSFFSFPPNYITYEIYDIDKRKSVYLESFDKYTENIFINRLKSDELLLVSQNKIYILHIK